MKKKFLFLMTLGFGAAWFLSACNQEIKEAKEEAEEIATEEVAADINGSYTVLAETSELFWTGRKVVSAHNGTIQVKSGTFTVTNSLLTAGEIVVDMTSIANTDLEDAEMNAKLVGHLSDDDFFGVKNFPEAILKVTSVDGNNVTADLTIKGETHPVTFEAFVEEIAEGTKVSGMLKVDRVLYGIKYGSGQFFKDLGDKTIADEFEIEFQIIGK